MDAEEYACLPEGSMCENCIYCVKRIIEPLDEENWEVMDKEEDGVVENIYVQACCLILDIELHDHIVKACNKFDDGAAGNPFLQNKFLY
jgi:hypothetical protein